MDDLKLKCIYAVARMLKLSSRMVKVSEEVYKACTLISMDFLCRLRILAN